MQLFPAFVRPLAFTILSWLVLNGAAFWLVVKPEALAPAFLPLWQAYFWVLPLYNVALFTGIWLYRSHFTDLEGRPLTAMNLPNALTLFRMVSLPTMAFWFLLARDHQISAWPLIALVVLAFLTDLLDGLLSRTLGQGTEIGRLLDPGSDYLVLATLTILLTATGVLPVWLLVLIIVRMGFYTLGLIWLSQVKKRTFVHSTFWGKASFFMLMVLYAVEIFVFLRFPGMADNTIVHVIEYFTGAVLVVSVVDKALFVARELKTGS